MKIKKIVSLLCFVLCVFYSVNIFAVSAESYVVMDADTGKILLNKNSAKPLGMASTTKIMTGILALEHAKLDDIVTVSKNAAYTEGSSLYLKEGEKIPMEHLLYGLMLHSGNDAATAIAEHISGSVEKFAELMNKKAEELKLKNTHFTNPHGLSDDNHYTTATELAKITQYALKNKEFAKIVGTKKIKLGERYFSNHNKMLRYYEGATGVKTGFTKKTGRTLVTSASRDGVNLIAVTLNAPDDWNDHTFLLNKGFSISKAKTTFSSNDKFTFKENVVAIFVTLLTYF